MMDSASSGSMQSSSGGGCGDGGGGNDEYESHGGELMSPFLKIHVPSSHEPHQPPPPSFFDLSYILDESFQQNANLHHYLTSNHLNFGNLSSSSSSSSSSIASFISQSLLVGSQSNSSNNNNNINQASLSTHFMSANEECKNNHSSGNKRPDEQKNIIGIKNSFKKRNRASRRAPTTILNTDTINFRQMVQEFTGVPAMSALVSSNPLRPLAQKGSSSTSPSLLNSRLINARSDFKAVPPNLKQPHQNQTENVFNNMQNQYTFQQLQKSTISPVFKDRSQGSLSMADLDELARMHNHHH